MNYFYRQNPPGPPPSYIPEKPSTGKSQQFGPGPGFPMYPGQTDFGPSPKAVDPGAIRFCRYKFTYIWLENGRSFWVWLIFVGRDSIAGYRWRRGNWSFWGTDIRNVDSFTCF